MKYPGILVAAVLLSGCKGGTLDADAACTGWPDWNTSSYILPYQTGTAYTVIQGQCSPPGNGHRGENRYAFDFGMAINTAFIAARSGNVVSLVESHQDGEVGATGFDNYIVVQHADGTAALYGHITRNGAVVGIGSSVTQGELLGFSGNTGNTGNVPHLHFSVHRCNPVTGGSEGCPTVPSNFRNTDPNPQGLQTGRAYPAQ
ncbi:MAG: M23 family metallopeptidase [Anaerolineae bacterium]|nr:M23 family metallopeptidase [Gemmatimonadaceae bacterium]